jgi:hypothetical protein
VLDVDDDLAVVDQHPTSVALALATDRLGTDLTELLLDLVDDRLDLTVVRSRAEHEGVGDDELVGHVEGDDVVGELVAGGLSGDGDELGGAISGGHVVPWSWGSFGCSGATVAWRGPALGSPSAPGGSVAGR